MAATDRPGALASPRACAQYEDELDLPDPTLTWLGERTLQASGSMTIDDANEELTLLGRMRITLPAADPDDARQ